MNGPQHYREAEKDLATANESSISDGTAAFYLASAQVHATLALAAITADGQIEKLNTLGTGARARMVGWNEAIG